MPIRKKTNKQKTDNFNLIKLLLIFSVKLSFMMCSSVQTTHSSVFQEHLFEGNEVGKCQQHVEDVPRNLLFVLSADGGETMDLI